MALEMKIGLEAEVLVEEKGALVMPPTCLDLDDFPVLAEVRSLPGTSMPDTVASFHKAYLTAEQKLKKDQTFLAAEIACLPLPLYRLAMKAARGGKGDIAANVKNLYGIDISDFSDQIIKGGRLQGANISCGLHLHFSCEETATRHLSVPKYKHVKVPHVGDLSLYYCTDDKNSEKIEARVSVLTRPVVEHLVKAMDDRFFERFAPDKDKRTKYRQPGFFELKPYGFEYRSLPFSPATHAALPEITSFAFGLMQNLFKW